jgi:hypothetical protein
MVLMMLASNPKDKHMPNLVRDCLKLFAEQSADCGCLRLRFRSSLLR